MENLTNIKDIKVILSESDILYKIGLNKVYDLEIYFKCERDKNYIKLDYSNKFHHQFIDCLLLELL